MNVIIEISACRATLLTQIRALPPQTRTLRTQSTQITRTEKKRA